MGMNSAIEWTQHTWSPWEGCQKVGPGCDHCYAESMNRWLHGGENWGPGAPRRLYSEKHWRKPYEWNARAAAAGTRDRVFPSVCDPFDNAAPAGLRPRFWHLVENTPHLIWLVLTKRIGNARDMLPWGDGEPWPNVWLGATIVNREDLLRDAAKLKATRARVHFWSVEPMLGDLGEIPRELMPEWVIAGGESGRGARPMHPGWPRTLRDQCVSATVPFMFKQWGEWSPPATRDDLRFLGDRMRAGKAVHIYGDDREPDGRFRHGDDHMLRIGKKQSGRLLDGVLHDALPEVSYA